MALLIRFIVVSCLLATNILFGNSTIFQDPPEKLVVYWDVSMSMKNRDISSDITYLEAYFKSQDCDVTFKAFNTEIVQEETIEVRGGDWTSLKRELQNTIYDGMTSYQSLFKESETYDNYLLFSDADQSFDELKFPSNAKVNIVNSLEENGSKCTMTDNFERFNGLKKFM